MPVVAFSRDALVGKRTHWLLDVTYAGQVFRLARARLDIASTELGSLAYLDLLDELVFAETMDLFSDTLTPTTIPVECVLPVNVPKLIQEGHDLGGATAELSRWIEGTAYEDRRVFVRGRVVDPEYDLADDEGGCSVSFSVTQNLYDDRGRIPQAGAVVDATTWATTYLTTEDLGLDYPVIIGKPGRDPLEPTTGWITGSPGLWVEKQYLDHRLLLAGHAVQCTQVFVNGADFVAGLRFEVRHTTDALGRTVAYIDSQDASTPNADDDLLPQPHHQSFPGLDTGGVGGIIGSVAEDVFAPGVADVSALFVGWHDLTDPSLGGAIGQDGRLVRDAGDAIEFVLGYSTLTLDRGRFAAAKPLLSAFKVDACIDQGEIPWEWVASNLLPILPISIMVGPDGVYPIVWRHGAGPGDAAAHIDVDVDPSCEVADRVTIDNSHIVNDFRLEYALSFRTGEYNHVARLGSEFIPTTAYARGKLVADNAASTDFTGLTIALTSRTPGPDGVYAITLTDTGAITVTDNSTTRTVAITYNGGSSTTVAIENAINAGSTLIEAGQETDTTRWLSHAPFCSSFALQLDDAGTAGSLHCAHSQRRYVNDDGTGVFLEETSSICIYEEATAQAVLAWRALAFALARRTVEALLPENLWGWLALGDVVTFSSSRHYLDEQVCIVSAIEWGDDGRLGLRLELVEDPARDSRVTT